MRGIVRRLYLLCASATFALSAQTIVTLHAFNGVDGSLPQSAALVQGMDGNFYGVTDHGGANNAGTVFKITRAGKLTTLYSFCALSECLDGLHPGGVLVQDANGNFYGTTTQGGANGDSQFDGCGTIFKITPEGSLTTLYNFCSQPNMADGYAPSAGLIQTPDGDFYGTTSNYPDLQAGTVYKITRTGEFSTIHTFCANAGCPPGTYPYGGLALGPDGNFYGTTEYGGTNEFGTVYRLTPGGIFTSLHSFCEQAGCPDGMEPVDALAQDSNGNLYGTTPSGGGPCYLGPAGGCGTMFEITPSAVFTTLYHFCSTQPSCVNGEQPYAGLVLGSDGNFYGANKQGTFANIFRATPGGTVTPIYSPCTQAPCGYAPLATLLQGTDGDFYGTDTMNGGFPDFGTVFRVSTGLSPFVKARINSGQVGAGVDILGNTLGTAISVDFNGTPAEFKVVSNTLIRTRIPPGASSGTIQVVIPGGTLSSNVPFQVLP